MDTWILKMLRARNVRRIIACALLIVVVIILPFTQSRYFKNFLMGPYSLGPTYLNSISDISVEPRYFAKVAGSKVVDSGIQEITTTKEGGKETEKKVTASYYILFVGDRLLVCKSGSGPMTTFEGELTPLPADLEQKLFDTPDMKDIRGRFYPFYINDESFRFGGYFAIAVALICCIIVIWYGLPAWRYLQDPGSHPLVIRVKWWGDPISLANLFQRKDNIHRFKGGNSWAINNQFLIKSTFFSFDILRFSDLIWAYKKVTRHSINFIGITNRYAVLICNGYTTIIPASEKAIHNILAFAAQRAPWAVFGFSIKLENSYRINGRELIESVMQRKRELEQAEKVKSQVPPEF